MDEIRLDLWLRVGLAMLGLVYVLRLLRSYRRATDVAGPPRVVSRSLRSRVWATRIMVVSLLAIVPSYWIGVSVYVTIGLGWVAIAAGFGGTASSTRSRPAGTRWATW